jgi:hypothetical protein
MSEHAETSHAQPMARDGTAEPDAAGAGAAPRTRVSGSVVPPPGTRYTTAQPAAPPGAGDNPPAQDSPAQDPGARQPTSDGEGAEPSGPQGRAVQRAATQASRLWSICG